MEGIRGISRDTSPDGRRIRTPKRSNPALPPNVETIRIHARKHARTVVASISQKLDALLERNAEGGTSITQVFKGVLLPHRLDLLLTVAVQLVEDVDEEIGEYFQYLDREVSAHKAGASQDSCCQSPRVLYSPRQLEAFLLAATIAWLKWGRSVHPASRWA